MKHLLVICLLTTMSAFSADLWFSGMENGDRVEITSKVTGCFDDGSPRYYEVRMSEGACFFTQYLITWDKHTYGKIAEKRVLGELKLTAEDVRALDGLLAFYRGKKEVVSTTQEKLFVEYYEGSQRVKVENLEDESGGAGLRKVVGATTFYELSERARK